MIKYQFIGIVLLAIQVYFAQNYYTVKMELASISSIRNLRDSIREKLKTIDRNIYASDTYGSENEYTFSRLIGNIDSLLTDLSTLTRAPKKFVRLSTLNERNTIISYLTRIDTYYNSPANYVPQFEALKILLRSYNLRFSEDRQVEFVKELENVLNLKLHLEEELIEIRDLKSEIDKNDTLIKESYDSSSDNFLKISNLLTSINETKDTLIAQSNDLEEINGELIDIKNTALSNLEEIQSSAVESKSNEKLIDSFASKIHEREKRFEQLEHNTTQNNEKLIAYDDERKSILLESNNLIDSAKKALNYKTAEGISASFQGHYNTSNNKWIISGWIIGAIICLGSTVGLGIWVLQTAPTEIGLLIGRISLLPLPIIGAVFCANQYTKQKNIIEDYAYKMVLSKAIVGFSEQLKKNGSDNDEEYVHYIKTALEEIHKDPLRKRESKKSEKSTDLNGLVEIAERIVKMTKVEQ